MARVCYNCRTTLTTDNTYTNTGSVCKDCNTEMVYVGKWRRAGSAKIAEQIAKKLKEIRLLCKADVQTADASAVGDFDLNTLTLDRIAKLLGDNHGR